MPQTAEIISKQLNISPDLFVLKPEVVQFVKPGHKIGKVTIFLQSVSQEVIKFKLLNFIFTYL